MNIHHKQRQKHRSSNGVALVIVLSVIVLISALIILLMNRAGVDRANAASFRASMDTRNLRDYTVHLVQSQISSATTDDPTLAWASQPGAIRTYSATGSSLQNIFKLYSAPQLRGTGVSALSDDSTALKSGFSNSAMFTDLNDPVQTAAGMRYPILDPGARGQVQGFEIEPFAPVTARQEAPMPVWWLYILEDGSFVAPTVASPSNSVTVSGASTANPIVGRIAFWTDDETAKINVNTASGAPWDFANTTVTTNWGSTLTTRTPGNFWDTPIVGSTQDVNLAISQPWAGEYQRFPGHPATASLSAALPSLNTWPKIEQFSPRIADQDSLAGGSRRGSHVANLPNASAAQAVFRLPDPSARLFATLDDAFYRTDRLASPQLPSTELEQARFFMTATSRAPEVTPFNTPRVLNWPITTDKTLSPFDKLIAFCGTVGADTAIGGTDSYYFTRRSANALHPTNDYSIARNQTLQGYLRRMTTTSIPGFGGSSGILGKYPADQEQILTQIFDYIRSTNTRQNSSTVNNSPVADYFYAPAGAIFPTHGAGNTVGFGRWPTIGKTGIIFWFEKYTDPANKTTSSFTLCSRILFDVFFASHGNPEPNTFTNYRIRVSGLSSLTWGPNATNQEPIFPTDSQSSQGWGGGDHPLSHGGRLGPLGAPLTFLRNTVSSSSTDSFSPQFPSNSPTFHFGGGTITVRIEAAADSSLVNQTINITLPPATLPIPRDNADINNVSFNGHGSWGWSAGGTTRTGGNAFTLFQPRDVLRMVGTTHGDFRLVAASSSVPDTDFSPFDPNGLYYSDAAYLVHNFVGEFPYAFRAARFMKGNLYDSNNTDWVAIEENTMNNPWETFRLRWVSGGDFTAPLTAGFDDFDNAYGAGGDGPYINFPDEGNVRITPHSWGTRHGVPYLDDAINFVQATEGYYSPNRLVPSAGILGSLPTGVKAKNPWQTLLFRPAALVTARQVGATHPGLSTPPDYLLLDLFNMPVVEPYAISEPLSTSGKVNMNYKIQPFDWIHRSTAVKAALHTEHLLAISNSLLANQFRYSSSSDGNAAVNSRHTLNLSRTNGTLKGFEDRFATGDIFRSAAEICGIPLVPEASGASYDNMATWWQSYKLTGDNSKERPYARIYPKLTTKSNTFTVHYRVEALKKRPSGNQELWEEGRDTVTASLRGAAMIERFVDPRDPNLPNYAAMTTLPPTGADALPNFYRWRILSDTQFNP